jgi:protein subunit release factor A
MSRVKLGNSWPYEVTRDDLDIKWCRGSGKGGQARNKTSNCCQITHIPTGIQVRAGEERMASQNLKLAFHKLADKLIPMMKELIAKKNGEVTKEMVTERIRTYHEKDNRVIDDRLPGKTFSYDRVLDGKDLDKVIQELINSAK